MGAVKGQSTYDLVPEVSVGEKSRGTGSCLGMCILMYLLLVPFPP